MNKHYQMQKILYGTIALMMLMLLICFDNLVDQLSLRSQLSAEYNQDLMSKSDAQIAEAVICGELKRLTGRWPKRPAQQIGSVHSYKALSFISFQTESCKSCLKRFSKLSMKYWKMVACRSRGN